MKVTQTIELTDEERLTVDDLSSLELEKPKGEWLWLGFDDGDSRKWSCNKCGRGVKEQENFYPNCGAKMRGIKKEAENDI